MYFGNSSLYNDNDLSLNEGVLGTIGALIILPYAIALGLLIILSPIIAICKISNKNNIKNVKEQIDSNSELKSNLSKLLKELEKDLNYVLKPYKKYITTNTDVNNFKLYNDKKPDKTYVNSIQYTKFCSIDMEKLFKDIYHQDLEDYAYSGDNPDDCKPAPNFTKEIKIIRKNIKSLNTSISKITKSKAIYFEFEQSDEDNDELYYDSYSNSIDGFYISLIINIESFKNIKLPNYKNK